MSHPAYFSIVCVPVFCVPVICACVAIGCQGNDYTEMFLFWMHCPTSVRFSFDIFWQLFSFITHFCCQFLDPHVEPFADQELIPVSWTQLALALIWSVLHTSFQRIPSFSQWNSCPALRRGYVLSCPLF